MNWTFDIMDRGMAFHASTHGIKGPGGKKGGLAGNGWKTYSFLVVGPMQTKQNIYTAPNL